ncbi:MAG: 23S rRNA (adenine(2503)-C(2))-methyltransferase RlmN [Erysipelotrichaceae bacterium]
MRSIFDFTYEELISELEKNNYKKYKAKQVFQWLYRKKEFDYFKMSDISKEMMAFLANNYDNQLVKIVRKQVSKDKTIKYLFALGDGELVETVIMFHDYGASVCVSSQVGCNMGCKFCASGLLKKKRDLVASEMVMQILICQLELEKMDQRVSNVVVMGSGEPFDNYDNVIRFLNIINSDLGLAIGARHLTVSTCGLVPGILKFAHEKQFNLAISLHGSNDELRSSLMPINNKYSLSQLFDALRQYQEISKRRLSFEYILIKGLNDKYENAQELKKLVYGLDAYINLIPYNSVDEHDFQSSSAVDALKFYDYLKKLNVSVTLRAEHGSDIDGACGQLRNKVIRGDN